MVMPEPEGATIVLHGSFSPAIFHPIWFATNELLRPEEAEVAEIEVVHSEFAAFAAAAMGVEVNLDRFVVSTRRPAQYSVIRDLVVGTFSLLSHTPVHTLEMNRWFRYEMASERDRDELLHTLAPSDPWREVFTQGQHVDVRSVAVSSPRTDQLDGFTRVSIIPPSSTARILVTVNDHYVLGSPEDPTLGSGKVVEIVREGWDASMKRAKEIAEAVREVQG